MNYRLSPYTLQMLLTIVFVLSISIPVHAQPTAQSCAERVEFQLPYERAFAGSVAWSPDGEFIAVIYSLTDEYGTVVEQSLVVFDSTNFEVMADFERDLINYASPFDNIYWSPNSERLAVANGINGVEVIEVAYWERQRLPSPESREFVQQMMWSADSLELAIVSSEPDTEADFRLQLGNTIRIWSVMDATMQVVRENLLQVRVSHFQGQWHFALVDTESEQLSVFQLGNEVPIFEITDTYLVDITSMNERLVLASVQFDPRNSDHTILQVWEIENGTELLELVGEESLAYSYLSTELLMAYIGSQGWALYTLEDGVDITLQNQERMTPTPNGQYVVSVEAIGGGSSTISATGDIAITEISTGEVIATFADAFEATLAVGWSPDSLTLTVAGVSNRIINYSLSTCFG